MTLNRRWIVALGFTALLGASAVQAEELDRANVPFAFNVAGKQQEAGSYSAQRQSNVLIVRNNASRNEVMVVPIPAKVDYKAASSMTFERYGSQYFLRKVAFNTGYVYELARTKHEKELARAERPEVILVAMR